jgi:predicted Zn-ribbon and HTH transcriptional regulator
VKKQLTDYVPLEERDPSTVRAVILSRKSSNGDEEEVKSQVEECQKFIEQRGWKLVADPYQYAEIGKSGRRNVVRKVLEAVVLLAQKREVDVIVARESQRLSRVGERLNFYVELCKTFDVEWRFANIQPDGKLPDTWEGKLRGLIEGLFGELEAERIAERMGPGSRTTVCRWLPSRRSLWPALWLQMAPESSRRQDIQRVSRRPRKGHHRTRDLYTPRHRRERDRAKPRGGTECSWHP